MTDPREIEPTGPGLGPGGVVPRDLIPASVKEPVRCRAHTSKGKPCGKWAIVGGFVCMTHGGTAPQVRRRANERLLAMAPRAVQIIVELAEGSGSDVVRLRAATELLDRGLGKAVDVTLDITPHDPDSGPSPLDLRISAALDARAIGPGQPIVDAESEETGVTDATIVDPETPSAT